jgi:hypothetical protein
VTYELVKNYKSSKGKTYLKRLPLECREHVQDETLSYWVEDFDRELTESEVGLWVKCVVDYAKSQGG